MDTTKCSQNGYTRITVANTRNLESIKETSHWHKRFLLILVLFLSFFLPLKPCRIIITEFLRSAFALMTRMKDCGFKDTYCEVPVRRYVPFFRP